jgi:membrane fusion protein, copper/silver efflux system
MKKNNSYLLIISAIILGFLAGGLFFSSEDSHNETHHNTAEKSGIWTCAMHPQIEQEHPGLCPICGMELVPQMQSLHNNDFALEMSETAMQLAQIQTTLVLKQKGDGGANILLNGRLMADETKTAHIVNHIPGRIEKLAINYTGAEVSKGQPIAWLYSPELITVQNELLEAKKIEHLSPGLLAATINKLKFWKLPQVFINELLSSKSIVETFPLFAEHSGIVVQKNVAVGDYLNRGAILFEVQNLNELWAVFDVYEKDLAQIKKGQTLVFSVPAFPNQQFSGKIHFIDPYINAQTRVAQIRVMVKNKEGLLKPEMLITGSLTNKNDATESLWIPKSAVLWTGKRSVVYVKLPHQSAPTFAYREVVLGISQGTSYEILEGLEAGEEVVTNGAFVIDATAQINNKASMMNRPLELNHPVEYSHPIIDSLPKPTAFKKQLSTFTSSYLELKNAFVKSDEKATASLAFTMLQQLKQWDVANFQNKSLSTLKEEQKKTTSALTEISRGQDIAQQREQFIVVSKSLITLLKAFNAYPQTLYVQHCPMANNNKGADWLSKKSEIENPYYGTAMLQCGSLVDILSN